MIVPETCLKNCIGLVAEQRGYKLCFTAVHRATKSYSRKS